MMERPLSGSSIFRLCGIGLVVTLGLGALALSVFEDLSSLVRRRGPRLFDRN